MKVTKSISVEYETAQLMEQLKKKINISLECEKFILKLIKKHKLTLK